MTEIEMRTLKQHKYIQKLERSNNQRLIFAHSIFLLFIQ